MHILTRRNKVCSENNASLFKHGHSLQQGPILFSDSIFSGLKLLSVSILLFEFSSRLKISEKGYDWARRSGYISDFINAEGRVGIQVEQVLINLP